jgi:hypothetical protein
LGRKQETAVLHIQYFFQDGLKTVVQRTVYYICPSLRISVVVISICKCIIDGDETILAG